MNNNSIMPGSNIAGKKNDHGEGGVDGDIGATGGSGLENSDEDHCEGKIANGPSLERQDLEINSQVELKVFETCSIYCLKYLLWRKTQVPIQDQVLYYDSKALDNPYEVRQYTLIDNHQLMMSPSSSQDAHLSSDVGQNKPYELQLTVQPRRSQLSGSLA
jgi:hypothetical protein